METFNPTETLILTPTSLIGWISHLFLLIGMVALMLNLVKICVYMARADTLADFLGLDGRIKQEIDSIKKQFADQKMSDWDIRCLAYDKCLSEGKQNLFGLIGWIFLAIVVKFLLS